MEGAVEFEAEVPIPNTNLGLYRRIYVLEQWLRRFVMAALMSRYATQWRSAIPTDVSKAIKTRRGQLGARTVFDVEASDNVIWLMTLEEIRQLLTSRFLWSSVKELTGLQKADVAARIDELREIRNVVGHSRATTPQTVRIFDGIENYLNLGVDRFRQATLYDESSHMFSSVEDDLAASVETLWEGQTRQVFLQGSEKFYAAVSLPIHPFTLMSVPDLVEAFHEVRHLILALYVNGTTNEFSVVWPRGAVADEHRAVIEAFGATPVFTDVEYREQDPKYVCDPRVWFYFDELRPGGWPPRDR